MTLLPPIQAHSLVCAQTEGEMIANASKNANDGPCSKQSFLVRITVPLGADFANHHTPVWQLADVQFCTSSQRRRARPRRKACRSLRRIIRPRHLVDDALDDDDFNADAASHIRQELGDEVVGGSDGQADGVALGAGETSGSIRKLA